MARKVLVEILGRAGVPIDRMNIFTGTFTVSGSQYSAERSSMTELHDAAEAEGGDQSG